MRRGFAMALAGAVIGAAVLAPAARADLPGRHPYYLHGLSDLRAARWMLEHRAGDARVSGHEDVAIQQIDATIRDLRAASVDDGKDLHDHVGVDLPGDHPGRLHRALELLRKVHGDVGREEDDPTARDLKRHSLEHIDDAARQTEAAIVDVERRS